MLKNILITGGAGYIGSHTAKAFLDKGYGVVVIDDLSTGRLEAVPEGAGFVKVNIHNVREIIDIIKKNQIDGVIHFAAKIIVPESLLCPLEYYSNNTGGVMSMLHACKATGIKRFVFSSTAAVYGDAGSELITEDFPIKALNPYGLSKYFSECIIRDCGSAHGINNVILRYFNVAGAAHDISNGQRSKVSTHLIKLAAETACGVHPSLKITGTDFKTKDGTGVRDYIHVEDLAELHTLAFLYLENGGSSDIFNCGYGHGYSVREVIDTMKKVTGIDFRVLETERRSGDAAALVASNEKIKKAFSWSPHRNNLDLICQSAFKWEKVWQERLKKIHERESKILQQRNEHARETVEERSFQPGA